MNEFSDVHERMNRIENTQREQGISLARLDVAVSDQLASREWVREIVEPVADATREIKHAVDVLGKDNQKLNAAHDNLLQDRSKREKEEHEAKIASLKAQSWDSIIKEKWAPIGAFILVVAGVMTVLSNLFAAYLTHAVH